MPSTIRSPRQKLLVERITDARKEAGITQADLAKRFGKHQPFIANIEAGERRIDVVELIEIAEIIGMDIHALIDELKALPRW